MSRRFYDLQRIPRFYDLQRIPAVFRSRIPADVPVGDVLAGRQTLFDAYHPISLLKAGFGAGGTATDPRYDIALLFDHTELYRCRAGVLLVTSPYGRDPTTRDLAASIGLTVWDAGPCYHIDAVTYVRHDATVGKMRAWARKLGIDL